MKKKDILKLRPKFDYNGITLFDWFEIKQGKMFFCIQSGLNHADGETKSPFHYDKCIIGKKSKKESIKAFKKWWKIKK